MQGSDKSAGHGMGDSGFNMCHTYPGKGFCFPAGVMPAYNIPDTEGNAARLVLGAPCFCFGYFGFSGLALTQMVAGCFVRELGTSSLDLGAGLT